MRLVQGILLVGPILASMTAGCARAPDAPPPKSQHSRDSWCGEVIAQMTSQSTGGDGSYERTVAVREDVESSLLACPGAETVKSVPEEMMGANVWPEQPAIWVIAVQLAPGSPLLTQRPLYLHGVKVYFTVDIYGPTMPLSGPLTGMASQPSLDAWESIEFSSLMTRPISMR